MKLLERLRSSSSDRSPREPGNSSKEDQPPATPKPNTQMPLPSTSSSSATRQQQHVPSPSRRLSVPPPPLPSLFAPGQASEILNRKDLHELDSLLPAMYRGYSWDLLFSLGKHGSSFSTFYRRVKSKSPTILVIRTTENEVFGGFTTTPWSIHTTAAGPTYYGTGESFLFKLRPFRGSMDSSLGTSKDGVFNAEEEEEEEDEDEDEEGREEGGGRKRHPAGKVLQYFPWTRANTYYMLSTDKSLGMGGGGGDFGLFIGENFESGSSGESETFYNIPLARHKTFDILSFECWTLQHAATLPSSSSSSSSSPSSSLPPSSPSSFSSSSSFPMHQRSQSLDPRYGLHTSAYRSFYEVLEKDNHHNNNNNNSSSSSSSSSSSRGYGGEGGGGGEGQTPMNRNLTCPSSSSSSSATAQQQQQQQQQQRDCSHNNKKY